MRAVLASFVAGTLALTETLSTAGPSSGRVAFPPGFKWCAATAAHQIEGGGSNSDWWDFERAAGHIKNGDRSGKGCDHWNHVEEDVGLLRDLHVKQYRFSIEWARIEPEAGRWDETAAEHYRGELRALRAAGIEPLITLHHFTLPRWFAALGSWESPRAPELFARYAAHVLSSIAPDARDWITFNEPMVLLVKGYMDGTWPPGRKGPMGDLLPPLRGLLRAHAAAYAAMKKANPRIRIGMAHHLRIFDPPAGWHPLDSYLAAKMADAFDWALPRSLETGELRLRIPFAVSADERIEGLAGTQDFVGINYYTRDIVRVVLGGSGFSLGVPKDAPVNDLGWEIYPEGMHRILRSAAERFPRKPILITENGIADREDSRRPQFLREHLTQIARAIADGVPVEGYCHWSLMDNFEWAEGFGPRFGLYSVDYATTARAPRESAKIFARIAAENGF